MLGSETLAAPLPAAPLVGFSFSPVLSEWMDTDPEANLRTLLDDTDPDLVRLPVYWDSVQPSPGHLDFASVDDLLAVSAHNLDVARQTRVILTVGARNFLYPELHMPDWAGPRQQPELGVAQQGEAYRTYFDATITRYRGSPLLYAWQVENEAYDSVLNETTTGPDQITPEQMEWEVGQVHQLDPDHRAVTTTFDGWNVLVDWMQLNATSVLQALHGYPSGHPGSTLAAGDALGLDIYVDGPTTPLRFTSISLRTSWKAESIAYWAGLAHAEGKAMWLTEVQAQPWSTSGGAFSTEDLLASAAAYRRDPIQVVLLWGVETWLQDPAWMRAASGAMAVLRAGPSAN